MAEVLGGLRLDLRPATSDRVAAEENLVSVPVEKHIAVRPGQRWLDLGAYIGTFSLYILSKGGEVFWVEADPGNAIQLRRNLGLNVHLGVPPGQEVAVMLVPPRSGYVELVCGPVGRGRTNYWSNTIYDRWKRSYPRVRCRASKFSAVCVAARRALPGGGEWCLKLDVEGVEIDILEHADLSMFSQIYFEYHFQADRSVPRARAIMGRLRGLGYQVCTTALPKQDAPQHWREMIFTGWASRAQ